MLLCSALLCSALLCSALLPYHTLPYPTLPYHTIPYHTIPSHPSISTTPPHPSQVTKACKNNGGFYLGSIGGPAAILAQNCIKKVEVQVRRALE